jgi:hypothetical protein
MRAIFSLPAESFGHLAQGSRDSGIRFRATGLAVLAYRERLGTREGAWGSGVEVILLS